MPPKGYKKKPIIVESDSDDEKKQNNVTEGLVKLIDDTVEVKNDNQFDLIKLTNQLPDLTKLNQEVFNIINSKNFEEIHKITTKIENILDVLTIDHNSIEKESNKIFTLNNQYRNSIIFVQDTINLLKKEEKKLKEESEKKLKENKVVIVQDTASKQYNSVNELINVLTNEHQQSILYRINTDAENAKVYLQNFELNTDKKKKTLKGTIYILGNYNRSKGLRESYEVKVFEKDPKGSFWCTCADHKFNSGKKNIVCKHICFIVCKVLKILQPYFFETKTLKPEHLQQLLDKFNINSDMWKDKKVARTSNKVTIDDFKIFPEKITDVCTFCYDEMSDTDRQIACACPLCKHCFHEECMDVWMEGHDKCSYCFNGFWTYYKRIRGGEKVIMLASNQL